MNENIDLTKILKDCPKGTKFYTPVWGEVVFIKVEKYKKCLYPICINTNASCSYTCLAKDGRYITSREETECILFPSKDQRDWSKFSAPWYKKEKFDPKTLKPFDRVLVSDEEGKYEWTCKFFSHYRDCKLNKYRYTTTANVYKYCIPYNDDTKHLVGTTDEAPEYYRYWEE